MIKVKTAEEIERIRDSCQVVVKVIQRLRDYIQPGVSTEQLDQQAFQTLQELGAVSAFKGYRGYPANICTSVNEQVVHGIPSKRRLQQGDIISIDVGAKLNGYFGDAACTLAVGRVSAAAEQLISCARQALDVGIAQARANQHLSDISSAIQAHTEGRGFSVVRKFVGHGIGAQMHEEPEIPNFGQPGLGPNLKPGMVLAIEPMVNQGSFEVEILKDKWTAVTKDRKLSVHFEHTICVTEGEPEILTNLGV